MKVKVDVTNETRSYRTYSEVEDWDICESAAEVYAAAVKEHGRCISKIYIDGKDGATKHLGWVFQKRVKYDDCDETYLQETWICPLKKYEVKHIEEYAL